MKLSPRYYGPYRILQKIGTMAYKLELPGHSRIHPFFHVSHLKQKLGVAEIAVEELPSVSEEGIVTFEPKWILDIRWIKVGIKLFKKP